MQWRLLTPFWVFNFSFSFSFSWNQLRSFQTSLLRKGRTGIYFQDDTSRPALARGLPPSQNRRQYFSHGSKLSAAICDPGRSSQAAALDAASWKWISVLSLLPDLLQLREKAVEFLSVNMKRAKGSQVEGSRRVESAADVLASMTRVSSAIERVGKNLPERRPWHLTW